jgi:chromosome segregation ATPase
VADLTSQCVGLKEEGATDCEEVRRLRAEVVGLRAEADRHEEALQQAQEGLQAVMEERDSLARSLEDEWSTGQALNAQIKGVLLMSCFAFRVRLFVLASA